jgi:hypothetical protein
MWELCQIHVQLGNTDIGFMLLLYSPLCYISYLNLQILVTMSKDQIDYV